MNYFAHGLRFLDRPHFLAGTAVPDWLSVVDRRVRVRPRLTEPLATGDGSDYAEVAAGILQHFHDDGWFHTTQAFAETSWKLTAAFRELDHGREEIRASFLGHIVTEMLLDAVLIARDPQRLDDYYAVLAGADPASVQEVVNRASRRPTQRLGDWIAVFLRERFLHDYLELPRLLHRLNQVMRRVKLHPLPEATIEVLETGHGMVASRVDELLPRKHWSVGVMESWSHGVMQALRYSISPNSITPLQGPTPDEIRHESPALDIRRRRVDLSAAGADPGLGF